jgi:hypothetical protein
VGYDIRANAKNKEDSLGIAVQEINFTLTLENDAKLKVCHSFYTSDSKVPFGNVNIPIEAGRCK